MSIDLVPEWTVGDVCLTSYPFGVDADSAVDIGEPEMIVEGITSSLADGDPERVVRHGNRTYVIPFYAMGASLGELAEAEALLRAEIKKTGLLLTHDPGDDFTPASVYEVQTAKLTPERDDTREAHLIRRFTLTLTCAPWAMSETDITIAALDVGASSSSISVDTCDSTSGWSGSRSGAGSPALGMWTGGVGVVDLDSPVTSPETWTLTRTGSVDFTTTGYLIIQARTVSPLNDYITVYPSASASGAALEMVSMRLIEAGGWYEVVYRASGVVPALTFVHTSAPAESWQGLIVRDILRANRPPSLTGRQSTRLIEVGGTERTPGSLRIAAPDGTTPLTLSVVATWPDDGSGFSPPLRRWRGGGNTEGTLAGTISGKSEPLGPAYVYFDVPIESLPNGTYQLMGLMSSTVAGTYAIESVIQSRHNGVTLGETTWGAGGTERVGFPFANDWKLVPMGVYGIPIAAAKAGEFRILVKTPGTESVYFDEAWLFPVGDDCALSAVLATEPHLWIDSADTESREPHIWEGDSADKSDAHFPTNGIHTMGQHVFTPPRTAVFAATHGVSWPVPTLTYRKRWHSNAAED